MRYPIAMWFAASLVGVVIVALPDDDQRLVSLSETHGPSALDAVGIGFLLAGWLVFVGALVRRRACIAKNVRGRPTALVIPLLAAGGIALTAVPVAADLGWWWLSGVVLLILVQLWLAELAITS